MSRIRNYYRLLPFCYALVLLSACQTEHVDVESRVISWLGEFSYIGQFDHHHRSNFKKVDYDQWIARGKAIEGAEPVLRKLLEENDPRVELPQVAYALAWVGTRESVPVLIEALHHKDYRLRREAAVALKHIRDQEAEIPLCRVLEVDDNANVRVNAVLALQELGTGKAIPYLEARLRDESAFVAEEAAEAIARIRQRGTQAEGERPTMDKPIGIDKGRTNSAGADRP